MTIVTDSEMMGDARIAGTRIAVYHIVQYRDSGFSVQEIAEEFNLLDEEVEEAIEYSQSG